MAVPTWDQFMAPVLRLLLDGEVRNRRECHGLVADAMALTEEQRTELLNSGHVKYRNRIGWAMSYLTRVGALDRPAGVNTPSRMWGGNFLRSTATASLSRTCG